MSEVCELWLKKCQQEQTPPTWQAVAEILDLIGHSDFSKKLLMVYNTGMRGDIFRTYVLYYFLTKRT